LVASVLNVFSVNSTLPATERIDSSQESPLGLSLEFQQRHLQISKSGRLLGSSGAHRRATPLVDAQPSHGQRQVVRHQSERTDLQFVGRRLNTAGRRGTFPRRLRHALPRGMRAAI
jgi:hypothetical protein